MRGRRRAPDEPQEEADGQSAELALVLRAQHDPAAFDALFAGYWHPVLAYCAVRLGDREEAQDTAQEVLIAVANQLPHFSPRGHASFRSWVFTIAHHKTADAQRRKLRRQVIPFPDLARWIDPAASPEEEAVRSSERAYCQQLLSTLRPDQRDVLELRAGELTTREIASVLRIKEDNVRKLQARAIAALRLATREKIGGPS